MSRVNEIYTTVATMELPALHARRAEILATVNGAYSELPDEPLAELCAITQALRRKAASPGGAPGVKRKAVKQPQTIEDIL